MSEMMEFPETWEEYKKLYSFCDREEVYTNGSELMSILRIEQWLEHIENKFPSAQPDLQPTCNQLATDCISRQKAIMDAESWVVVDEYEKHLQKNVVEWLKELPSAEPESPCTVCQEFDCYGCKFRRTT